MRTPQGIAVASTAAIAALTLAGCAPSLGSVATECGGSDAGIANDDTTLIIDLTYGPDALNCVAEKLFDSDADQYAVALAADAGSPQKLTIGGRSVEVEEFGGSTLVLIGSK